jgi:hypothetical protein
MSNDDVIGKRVKIRYTDTKAYLTYGLIGKCGTVERVSIKSNGSRGSLGVAIDGKGNPASSYGLFWFDESDLIFIENESEENVMEGFKYVAIVNLVEDCYKKDYAFALYEEDYRMITFVEAVKSPAMVVVNARSKNNRMLATVKKIVPVEEYNGTKITAEVVGVVDMNRFIRREEEKVRLKELAKKRAAIEAEIEKEINKRKSVEYYEEMAKKYADNPRLAELVGELRGLGA